MSRYVDISPYEKCRIVLHKDDSGFPVSELPTVDAVEVVRCGECKHRKSVWRKDGRMKDGGYYYYCELDTGDPYALGREAEQGDWFCADGERKEVIE